MVAIVLVVPITPLCYCSDGDWSNVSRISSR